MAKPANQHKCRRYDAQLADVDAHIEAQQRDNEVTFGKRDLAQAAGKSQAVHQPEREYHRQAARAQPRLEYVFSGDPCN